MYLQDNPDERWQIFKRYTEFKKLHKAVRAPRNRVVAGGWSHRQHRFAQLRKRYRKTKLPQLPYFSAFNRQRADIVQSRRKVLLKYLHLLVMNEIAVDSVDLASFLEITRHLDGFKTMHRTSSSTLPRVLAR